jgi:hypothetical protein
MSRDFAEPADPPTREPSVDDREAIRRHLADPKVQELIRQVFEDLGKPSDEPGVTAEELPQFLRDRRL